MNSDHNNIMTTVSLAVSSFSQQQFSDRRNKIIKMIKNADEKQFFINIENVILSPPRRPRLLCDGDNNVNNSNNNPFASRCTDSSFPLSTIASTGEEERRMAAKKRSPRFFSFFFFFFYHDSVSSPHLSSPPHSWRGKDSSSSTITTTVIAIILTIFACAATTMTNRTPEELYNNFSSLRVSSSSFAPSGIPDHWDFSSLSSSFSSSSSKISSSFSGFPTFIRFASAVRVGVIGPAYSVDPRAAPMTAVLDGLRLAFANQNKVGGVQGKPIELIFRNYMIGMTPSTEAVLDAMMANESTRVDVLATPPTAEIIDALYLGAKRHNLTIIAPSGGAPHDYTEYTMHKVIIIPKPDVEVAAMIRHIVLQRHFKRIAVLVTYGHAYGNELLPYIRSLLGEFGLEICHTFVLQTPNMTDAQILAEGLKTRPQAVFLFGHMGTQTVEAMQTIYANLSSVAAAAASPSSSEFVIACTGVWYPMFLAAYAKIGIVPPPNTFLATSYVPSASYEASKAFDRALVEFPEIASLNHFYEPHQRVGFLIGTVMCSIFLSADNSRPIDASAVIEATFTGRIFKAYDYVYGPFSKPCEFSQTISCGCNVGARHVDLSMFDSTWRLRTMPNTRTDISLDSCTPKNELIQSPLIQLVATPTTNATPTMTEELVSVIQASVADYLGGDSGAYINATTSPSSRRGIIVEKPYRNVSDLYEIQDNRLVTISTGSVYSDHAMLVRNNNKKTDDADEVMTVAIDPLFIVPPFYKSTRDATASSSSSSFSSPIDSSSSSSDGSSGSSGAYSSPSFNERVVYLSPTLEQEIHALASHYRTFLTVTTEESMVDDFISYTTRSANTFGVEKAEGALILAKSVDVGLQVFIPQSSSASASPSSLPAGPHIFVHGIRSSADIDAINNYLGRTSSGDILVPSMHLTLWYDTITAIITDSRRRARVVFATNLPNWNPAAAADASSSSSASSPTTPAAAASASSLMQTYANAMREQSLPFSPQTLRGYLAQRFIANIVERIPARLTQESFLDTLYAVSVVVIESNAYTVGPLSKAKCASSSSSRSSSSSSSDNTIVCESNIGARHLRLRSLEASLSPVPTVANVQVADFVFTSANIDYRGLPEPEGLKAEIIAIIVCAVVVGVLLVALLLSFLIFRGSQRSHRNAPQDPSVPFTIAFSDIQSSTSLWAEIPEEMGAMIELHHKLIRALIKKHNGYEVKTIGDAFMIAFKRADDAVKLACELQFAFINCKEFSPLIDQAYINFDREKIALVRGGVGGGTLDSLFADDDEALTVKNLSCDLEPAVYKWLWRGLRVRVGINTDFGTIQKDPITNAYDYYGTVTNTAARVEAVCHGGQVCFTDGTLKALENISLVICTLDAINAEFDKIAVSAAAHYNNNNNNNNQTSDSSDEENHHHEHGSLLSLRCANLGAVELRGLGNPITMYQLECVVGRKFPSLRLGKAGVADDDDDNYNNTDLNNDGVNSTTDEASSTKASEDKVSGEVHGGGRQQLFAKGTAASKQDDFYDDAEKDRDHQSTHNSEGTHNHTNNGAAGAGGGAYSLPPHLFEVESSHLLVAIATLFSRLPTGEKKLKEYKRLCDMWGVQVGAKHAERMKAAATATPAMAAAMIDEKNLNRTIAMHVSKNDPIAAAHLDQLTRRLLSLASKNLQNALGTNPALVPLIHAHNNNHPQRGAAKRNTTTIATATIGGVASVTGRLHRALSLHNTSVSGGGTDAGDDDHVSQNNNSHNNIITTNGKVVTNLVGVVVGDDE